MKDNFLVSPGDPSILFLSFQDAMCFIFNSDFGILSGYRNIRKTGDAIASAGSAVESNVRKSHYIAIVRNYYDVIFLNLIKYGT